MITNLKSKLNFLKLMGCFLGIFLASGSNLWGADALFPAPEYQQTNAVKVSGTVTSAEDDEPLIGVSVLVKGTTSGTITDLDGRFELDASPEDVLVFSYTGYQRQEITVGTQTIIEIELVLPSV